MTVFDLLSEEDMEKNNLHNERENIKKFILEGFDKKFIDLYFGPDANSVSNGIILLIVLLCIFNIFLLIGLLLYFLIINRLTKSSKPSENAPIMEWIKFAEKNIDHNQKLAMSIYEHAHQLDPSNSTVLWMWGMFEGSRAVIFKKGQIANPKEIQYFQMYDANHAYKNITQAIGSETVFINPITHKREPVFNMVGTLAFDLGMMAEAEKYLKKSFQYNEMKDLAQKYNKKSDLAIKTRLMLCGVLLNQGNVEEGLNQLLLAKYYSQIYKDKKQESRCYELLGELFFINKHYQQSEEYFSQSIKYSHQWIAYKRLASIARAQQNNDKAERYEKILASIQK